MFSKEQFGQRVQELRGLCGETQKVLGEAIGMSANNVSEMEHGKKTTTSEKIALLCLHYNVSADYLLGLSDQPRPESGWWTDKKED